MRVAPRVASVWPSKPVRIACTYCGRDKRPHCIHRIAPRFPAQRVWSAQALKIRARA